MDVIEKAKELSMAVMQDERCRRFQLAKAERDADFELQKLIGQFNLNKIKLNAEYKKTPLEPEKLKGMEQELRDVYGVIMQNEHMKVFNNAKKEMDELLSHINGIIQLAVSGEVDDSSCAGDCASCGGCR